MNFKSLSTLFFGDWVHGHLKKKVRWCRQAKSEAKCNIILVGSTFGTINSPVQAWQLPLAILLAEYANSDRHASIAAVQDAVVCSSKRATSQLHQSYQSIIAWHKYVALFKLWIIWCLSIPKIWIVLVRHANLLHLDLLTIIRISLWINTNH
jgi:hypothetical protein